MTATLTEITHFCGDTRCAGELIEERGGTKHLRVSLLRFANGNGRIFDKAEEAIEWCKKHNVTLTE